MSVGQRIRKRRQVLRLTQKELARDVGLSTQHVSAIEQDKRAPSLPRLAKIASELGVSCDYLICGTESVVTDTIPAIKADKRLTPETKKILIDLARIFHNSYPGEEAL